MSDPKHSDTAQVDPSESPIDERGEQQGAQTGDDEGDESGGLAVDPSERPAQ